MPHFIKITFLLALLLTFGGVDAGARYVYLDSPLGKQFVVSDTVPGNDGSLRYHLRFGDVGTDKNDYGPDSVSCSINSGDNAFEIQWLTPIQSKFETDIVSKPSCRVILRQSGQSTLLKDFQPRKTRPGNPPLSIRFIAGDGRLNVEIGSASDNAETFSLDLPGISEGFIITCSFSRPKEILRRQLVYSVPDDLGTLEVSATAKDSSGKWSPSASKEADWVYLDRETNDSRCRLGGNYRIETISDGNDGFYMVYKDGAVKNPALWKPGKIKGRLVFNGFDGQYDLCWLDSFGFLVSGECFGEIDSTGTYLTLSFPEINSKIRFRRVVSGN